MQEEEDDGPLEGIVEEKGVFFEHQGQKQSAIL